MLCVWATVGIGHSGNDQEREKRDDEHGKIYNNEAADTRYTTVQEN